MLGLSSSSSSSSSSNNNNNNNSVQSDSVPICRVSSAHYYYYYYYFTEAMNTSQINMALTCDPIVGWYFGGVFACDRLPTDIPQKPYAVVANTDTSGKPGTHWVCYFLDEDGKLEYFDSYGLPPANEHLRAFYDNNGEERDHNKKQMQGAASTVCGHWCIAFLSKRGRGDTKAQIVRYWGGKVPGQSDELVGKLIEKSYRISEIATRVQSGCGIGGDDMGVDEIEQCCCARQDCCELLPDQM
jgi:hypothetical protein